MVTAVLAAGVSGADDATVAGGDPQAVRMNSVAARAVFFTRCKVPGFRRFSQVGGMTRPVIRGLDGQTPRNSHLNGLGHMPPAGTRRIRLGSSQPEDSGNPPAHRLRTRDHGWPGRSSTTGSRRKRSPTRQVIVSGMSSGRERGTE